MPTEDDELTLAEPEDFFVSRDEDDNLQPVTQPLPGVEQEIRVIPMTLGDINEYGSAEGRLNPANLDDEDVAEIINEHWYDVRERDDYDVTADMVAEDMIGFGKEALITAILRASGYDLQQSLNMEHLQMLDEVDDVGKLMELAETQG